MRIGGLIRNVEGPPVKADELKAFIASIAPKSVGDDIDRSLAAGSIFSTSIAPGRFRCTTFNQIGGPSLVLRVIPSTIRSVEELNLPPVVREIALASRGLILVVGPSGSGKTTTLAAMVDVINGASSQKIVTIEAPVEYVHANKKAMITQMEVGRNVTSFEHGLGLALQQDADVIVVGDVRDGVVARMILGAAEAGRKVLAVMTGLYATQAITRFISLIPPDERETAFSQLAAGARGRNCPAARQDAGWQAPARRRGVPRGGGGVRVDPREPSQGSELSHREPPGWDAVPGPAPDRAEPVRCDQRDGDDATGHQPRGRGPGASRPPSSEYRPGPCRPGSWWFRSGSPTVVGLARVARSSRFRRAAFPPRERAQVRLSTHASLELELPVDLHSGRTLALSSQKRIRSWSLQRPRSRSSRSRRSSVARPRRWGLTWARPSGGS